MRRFLAIVIALVLVALAINYMQKDKPVGEGDQPKLIAPEKIEAPAEKPAEVAEQVEAEVPAAEESTATPPSTEEAAPSP